MKNNVFLFIFLMLIFIFVAAVILTPTPIDWTFSYSRYDKNPHGSYLLYEELENVFPDATIETTDSTIFQVTKAWGKDSTAIIIISQYFSPLEFKSDPLDSFVFRGNNIFISANNINFNRTDSSSMGFRNISTTSFENDSFYYYNPGRKEKDKIVNAQLLNSEEVEITKIRKEYAYNRIRTDSTFHFKLGTIEREEEEGEELNFIRVPYGKGNYFFHSNPGIFTNNAMLHDSLTNYVTATLSHIGEVKYILWDEHQKPGFFFLGQPGESGNTPWTFIKNNKALNLAYLVALWGCILLIFTKFKREQQAIPVINPPKNSSVEFAETMGRFYHENGDNLDIGKKRMKYFEIDLRNAYNIHDVDDYKSKKAELARIIGIDENKISNFFQKREILNKVDQLTNNQLQKLSDSIEEMKIKV